MTIQLSSEQERAIQEAIRRGVVSSVGEFIDLAIAMLPQTKDHSKEHNVVTTPELMIRTQEFFANKSLDELAKAQGVKPLEDPSVLIGGWPEDEDLDEFLEMTYKERNASLMQSPDGSNPA